VENRLEGNLIKDIVLNLPLDADEDATITYAVSLAAAFDARVTGIAFAYEKMPAGILGDERWVDGVEELRKEAEQAADAAISKFENVARAAAISAATYRLATTFWGTADEFGRIARRFDLSVLRQPEPGTGRSDHLVFRAALFDSGRPVLIVPSTHKGQAKFERIMICWDGSRNAARAVADALPFLRRADGIEIVTIGSPRDNSEMVLGAGIAGHLKVHGIRATTKEIAATDVEVPSRILSHAATTNADLIVMGGYGHSRLRELVLGGATHGVIAAMSIPTLMSH
jgi:nucleotide-binding universal stress UspA family protein